MDIKEIKKQIVAIIKKHVGLPHYKVFLFGSRVNGQGSERSDFDIGFEAQKQLPAGLGLEIKEVLSCIRTLNKIDFVDFRTVDKNFKEVAMQNIEVLYEQ